MSHNPLPQGTCTCRELWLSDSSEVQQYASLSYLHQEVLRYLHDLFRELLVVCKVKVCCLKFICLH